MTITRRDMTLKRQSFLALVAAAMPTPVQAMSRTLLDRKVLKASRRSSSMIRTRVLFASRLVTPTV